MSHRIGNVTVICVEEDSICELCGAQEETRPYGPRGERICYDCGMKDKQATERQMARVLFGEDVS